MKTWTAVLALSLAPLALPLSAQTPMAGVHGGVSIADFAGPGTDPYQARARGSFGLYGTYGFSPWLGMQTGVDLTQKGGEWTLDPENHLDVRISYLEVPVLARLQWVVRPGLPVPHLLLGPSLALRVGCSLEGLVDGSPFGVECQHPDLASDVHTRRIDFGLVLGGGVDLPVTGGVMTLDARYNFGVAELGDYGEFDSARNNVLSLAVGFAKPLGR